MTFLIHITLLILHKDDQLGLYFDYTGDFLADFLNPVRYSANRDPYFDETILPFFHNQTGIFYIVCWAAARIASPVGQVAGASLQDLWNNHVLILISIFYLMANFIIFAHALSVLAKKFSVEKVVLFPLLLSSVVLFTIERGNHIMFSAACVF